ncbi:MAG: preprotein translocase subunit SecG [Elusimicrobia bacterium]|nr:preprotein translocase subunit SecG [Elusimicrobiota bacterium]
MYGFIYFVHILVCVILIIAILVFQTSKGSALSMFGGGGDSLFMSSTGTTFIKKFTIGAAIVFAITSLLLTLLSPTLSLRSVTQSYPFQAAPQQQEQKTPTAAPSGGQSAKPSPPAAEKK